MFSSISSKTAAVKPLTSPFALSQARKTAAKSIPVFGDEVAAASGTKAAKIPTRQNSVAAKTLAASAKANAQTLAAKSLTNKSLATNSSATAKTSTTSAALFSKTDTAKASTVKPAAGDTVETPPVDPAEAVRALLTEMGYDASKFKFEAHEEAVSYPGGGYTHRFTSVELPNGLKENFTTDLMGRFPTVTANELKRLMENQYQSAAVTVPSFNVGA